MTNSTHDATWLTVDEAAAELRLHPATIRRHIKDGTLEHMRLGKSIRIPRHALEAGFAEPEPDEGTPGRFAGIPQPGTD